MIKKWLGVSVVLFVVIATGIGIVNAANQQNPNTVVNAFNNQMATAQSNAVNGLQQNNYTYPSQPTNFVVPLDAMNSIAGAAGSIVTYLYNTLTVLLFQPTYNVGVGIAAGSMQPGILSTYDVSAAMAGLSPFQKPNPDSQPVTPATMLTAQAIYNTLTTVSDPAPMVLASYNNIVAPVTTNGCASGGASCDTSNPPNTDSLNFNTLVGPVVYNSSQEKSAHDYVLLATGAAIPVPGLDFTGVCGNPPDNNCVATTITKSPQILKYLASFRTYASQQSAGVSTLYDLLAERTLATALDGSGNPQPAHLGQNAGLPTTAPNFPEASPLQVDNYYATRRITDPNWYAAMETANAATLARESVYIAAETRVEMYKLRMEIERLTALTAILQLQQLRFTQSKYGESIRDQVASIQKTKPFNGQRTPK